MVFGFLVALALAFCVDGIDFLVVAFAVLVHALRLDMDQARLVEVLEEGLDADVLVVFGQRNYTLLNGFLLLFDDSAFTGSSRCSLASLLRISLGRSFALSRPLARNSLLLILLTHSLPLHFKQLQFFLIKLLPRRLPLLQGEASAGVGGFFGPTRLVSLPGSFQGLLAILLIGVLDEGNGL